MEKENKHKLSEWLDKIQQDSWQLELVITGFSIFLMLGVLNKLNDLRLDINLAVSGTDKLGFFLTIVWIMLAGANLFVLINLIIHAVLRGLWISAIGLRSVSGDIDFDRLGLSPKFDTFIRNKTGSFDSYIERLENLCSIVFAFTFLIVFVIMSLGLWGAFFGITLQLIRKILPDTPAQIVGVVAALLIFSTGVLYMIDFITLGWVKRRRWFSKIYYPIYRFYGVITLSALYRPMYYNLIDNKLGKKAGFLLIPYILLVLWVSSLGIDSHVWFPDDPEKTALYKGFYDDLRKEETLVGNASIPSRFVQNGFVELFIRYFPSEDDKTLLLKCPNVKSPKKPGIRSDIVLGINAGSEEPDKDFPGKSLECLSSIYEISIGDSVFTEPAFRFYNHPNKQEKGIITTLDVQYLPRGEHQITIRKFKKYRNEGKDSLRLEEFTAFPFWKE